MRETMLFKADVVHMPIDLVKTKQFDECVVVVVVCMCIVMLSLVCSSISIIVIVESMPHVVAVGCCCLFYRCS